MADIKRAAEDDWRQLRSVRLQALEADPSAFGSTLERELSFTEDTWRSRTRTSATFLAIQDGTPLGMATIRPEGPDRVGEINAMWVSPAARGAGLGQALLSALLQQARADGLQQVRLWATTGNEAATQLYEKCGFMPTGRTEPLQSDPQLTMLEYLLALA